MNVVDRELQIDIGTDSNSKSTVVYREHLHKLKMGRGTVTSVRNVASDLNYSLLIN